MSHLQTRSTPRARFHAAFTPHTRRDIKPENTVFTRGLQLKVTDFGLAIDQREERPVTRLGTLDYMVRVLCGSVEVWGAFHAHMHMHNGPSDWYRTCMNMDSPHPMHTNMHTDMHPSHAHRHAPQPCNQEMCIHMHPAMHLSHAHRHAPQPCKQAMHTGMHPSHASHPCMQHRTAVSPVVW
eukprot:365365-Chlamydomonas_euryale.AAC.3